MRQPRPTFQQLGRSSPEAERVKDAFRPKPMLDMDFAEIEARVLASVNPADLPDFLRPNNDG